MAYDRRHSPHLQEFNCDATPYAAAKLMGEESLRAAVAATPGFSGVALRIGECPSLLSLQSAIGGRADQRSTLGYVDIGNEWRREEEARTVVPLCCVALLCSVVQRHAALCCASLLLASKVGASLATTCQTR